MMIHSADIGAKGAKKTFDLRSLPKFCFPMDIVGVFHGPVFGNTPINESTISPEFDVGNHKLLEETHDVISIHRRSRKDMNGDL